jgi:phospho-N-acetylmuramoyl-pentapeptide-transferase
MTLFTFNIIRMLGFTALTATLALLAAPFLIVYLNKVKFWKKTARTKTITGAEATVFHSLHQQRETTVPRGGGLLIWVSVLFVTLVALLLSYIHQPWWLQLVNFLSRKETWLPLFTLVVGSLVGLTDDILTVYGGTLSVPFATLSRGGGKYIGGGMSFWRRLTAVALIGLVGGLWFYYKLGYVTMHIPLFFNFPQGIDVYIGILYIPLFVVVMLASWAGGVIDGIDGLAGGTFSSIFGAFAIIALSQGKADMATFCAIICGALFAFLWFNIPPAKFYMGETGVLGLTSTMTVVAFLTDSVIVLPIIAGLLVVEVGSIVIQLLSKRYLKKKIWQSTPIHHHFEAQGWPAAQVTMRFWVIGIVLAALGTALRLIG